ncbi:hypothetical protein RNJ44_00627 [Nakaseomyces bracarensis]|uniref:Uncharacterized protein n=1 Tax=Nakaseomyces bracarensis TaxID=273131 RepID=A0ABR4NRK7_9SACH
MSTAQNNSRAPGGPAWTDTPAFQESYKKAIEFYNKDEVLDARDRLELSKKYTSIARAQFIGGWTGFSAVFVTPFAYQYYKTGAIRGVKVPRNFVLGLVAMVFSTQISGNMMYRKQINDLDPTGELTARLESDLNHPNESNQYGDVQAEDELLLKESNVSHEPKSRIQKEFEMMKLLNNGSAPKWAMYFYATYQNPRRRFPNPVEKMKELKDMQNQPLAPFLKQRDPFGLFKDQNKPADNDNTSTSPNNTKPTPVPMVKPSVPLEDPKYEKSWGTIRQSSSGSSQSAWDRVRGGDYQNLNGTNSDDEYDPFEEVSEPPELDKPTKDQFNKLIEQERNGGSGVF